MSTFNKKTVRDIDVTGKKVIMRVDFNVPLKDGNITDDTRIRAALPTIQYLLKHGAAIILISHLGRPKGERKPELSLSPVAVRLGELLGQPVAFSADFIGAEAENAAAILQPGQVLLLENLRFHPEEEKNDPEFSAALAKLGQIFVSEAFGVAHRTHASTVGITALLPSVSGLLIENEVNQLNRAVENPQHPYVAIIGGAKISDKIKVLESLVLIADKLLIGGGMANTFLAASGCDMQGSLVDKNSLDWAKDFLARADVQSRIILPVDVVAASACTDDAEYKTVDIHDIPAGWMALDIGTKTRAKFAISVRDAKTVVWNGPLGVFEIDAFSGGTLDLAHAVAASSAFSVIGGGDSVSAVHKAGVADDISHISTGGGASLEFLEGKVLPGVAALSDR